MGPFQVEVDLVIWLIKQDLILRQSRIDNAAKASRLYNPLPTDETHIRLLGISHGDSDSPIECKLSVHKLSEAPAYSAVSYVWGDPWPIVSIEIDGLSIEVGSNCQYALRQLKSLNLASFYWIDALCINQVDLDEKSVQVWSMGQIYETAQQVLACVGPHTKDSLAFMNVVHVWPHIMDARIDRRYVRRDDLQEYENQLARHSEVKSLLFSQNSQMDVDEFCIAATNFCRRAYWYRLWIVQELALAREIRLICGFDVITWDQFSAVIISKYLRTKSQSNFFDHQDDSWWKGMWRSESMNNLENIVHTRRALRSQNTDGRLTQLLQRFQIMQCANALDRVYGFLHLMAKRYPREKRLIPDYKQSSLRLALQCLELLRLDHLEIERQQYRERSFLDSLAALLQALELGPGKFVAPELIQARQRYLLDHGADESTPVHIHSNESARDALQVSSRPRELVDEYVIFSAKSRPFALIEQSEDGELVIDIQVPDPQDFSLEALYSAALSYAGFQDATSEAPLSLKQKGQQPSASPAALVCSRARPGDYCIYALYVLAPRPSEFHFDPCMVLRRCESSRLLEVVGQGFLPHSAKFACDRKFQLAFYFSKEDLLAFAALEMREGNEIGRTNWFKEDQYSLHMPHVDRLFTALTSRAFSSFAIEETDPLDPDPR